MKDELITLETAQLAKEKGWNGDFVESAKILTAQSLLQKWLREVHDIVVYVLPHAPMKRVRAKIELYSPCLWYKNEYQSEMSSSKTYEQALEDGLKEALNLIK